MGDVYVWFDKLMKNSLLEILLLGKWLLVYMSCDLNKDS